MNDTELKVCTFLVKSKTYNNIIELFADNLTIDDKKLIFYLKGHRMAQFNSFDFWVKKIAKKNGVIEDE